MRRSERIAIDEAARLRPNGWSSLEVRLLDLSATGFRAACDARVLTGSMVRIDLSGIGEVEAQVSWHRDGEIGCKFVQPILLSMCRLDPVARERVLARLLVQRAEARSRGRFAQEQSLRAQILSTLPMRKL